MYKTWKPTWWMYATCDAWIVATWLRSLGSLHTPPDGFEKDVEALSKVLRVFQFTLIGGEPLLLGDSLLRYTYALRESRGSGKSILMPPTDCISKPSTENC